MGDVIGFIALTLFNVGCAYYCMSTRKETIKRQNTLIVDLIKDLEKSERQLHNRVFECAEFREWIGYKQLSHDFMKWRMVDSDVMVTGKSYSIASDGTITQRPTVGELVILVDGKLPPEPEPLTPDSACFHCPEDN